MIDDSNFGMAPTSYRVRLAAKRVVGYLAFALAAVLPGIFLIAFALGSEWLERRAWKRERQAMGRLR
jgi:hypothetical protein